MTIDRWLGNSFPLSSFQAGVDAGVDTARLIAEKPTSIVVRRAVVGNLAAQTVRIEPVGGLPLERTTNNITTSEQTALILGYKGHPTIADTNLKRGDRFYVASEDMMYTVIQILPGLENCLQAIAEATQGQ